MVERLTHAYDGPLAVFLIGLRIHQPWRIGVVGQAVRAMPRMIAELERNKAAAERGKAESLGYLGSRSTVHLTGTTMIQWWRSTDDLYAYASAADHEHRPAWTEFYKVARSAPDAVTIWHETYVVEPGGAESVYAGAKPFGLGAIAGTIPISRRGEHARDRLGKRAASRPTERSGRRRRTASAGGPQQGGPGAHPRVDLAVPGRRVHEPGVAEVLRDRPPVLPGHEPFGQ